MSVKLYLVLLGFFVVVAYAGHVRTPHTDGIEPYYNPKQLDQWIETVPEENRPFLFASEEDMAWWKEARFGLFYCWGPASMLEWICGRTSDTQQRLEQEAADSPSQGGGVADWPHPRRLALVARIYGWLGGQPHRGDPAPAFHSQGTACACEHLVFRIPQQ